MKNEKLGIREIIEKLENRKAGELKDNKLVDRKRALLFKLLSEVGIERNVFYSNDKKSYQFYQNDVAMILNYDYRTIRRHLNCKYENFDISTLNKSVLFFCTILENYIDDADILASAQAQVCKKLGYNYTIVNKKITNIRFAL